MFYIISLKHTYPRDKYMTLWRANNAGYCYNRNDAGIYNEIKEDYHNSVSAMPIEKEKLDDFFEDLKYDNSEKFYSMIPNTLKNRKKLGLCYRQNYLTRKPIQSHQNQK